MSINRLMLLQQAAAPTAPAAEPDGPEWLLQMLREQMTAVAREEGDTLKKAAMIARLGALYLRASGAVELKRTCRALTRRCASLEEQVATLRSSAASAPPPAAGPAAPPQPARGPADPLSTSAMPRVSVRAPIAPEPEPPRMLVIGPPTR